MGPTVVPVIYLMTLQVIVQLLVSLLGQGYNRPLAIEKSLTRRHFQRLQVVPVARRFYIVIQRANLSVIPPTHLPVSILGTLV